MPNKNHIANNMYLPDFYSQRFTNNSNCMFLSCHIHTQFRVNTHSVIAWMSRNFLLEAGMKSEV